MPCGKLAAVAVTSATAPKSILLRSRIVVSEKSRGELLPVFSQATCQYPQNRSDEDSRCQIQLTKIIDIDVLANCSDLCMANLSSARKRRRESVVSKDAL